MRSSSWNRKGSFWMVVALSAAAPAGAMALDTGVNRTLKVEFGSKSYDLANMSFLALGANGGSCDYLAVMGGTPNPNGDVLCVLHELRTSLAPSCILNEQMDIVTVVQAGEGSVTGPSQCSSSDIKGQTFDNVSLLLTEGPGGLWGIQIIHDTVPLVYPVRAN